MITTTILFFVGCTAPAEVEILDTPSLDELTAIVGISSSSAAFKDIVEQYKFTKFHKNDYTWGSSFGVFLVERKNGQIQIGMRPPSDAKDIGTSGYGGELPRGLKAGDSLSDVQEKLGQPVKTAHNPDVYYEMSYDGMTVYTMRGRLFEVWLLPNKQ
jgi:hypothetical protein